MQKPLQSILAVMVILAVVLIAADAMHARRPVVATPQRLANIPSSGDAWVSQAWTGDETPFREFRLSMDRAVAQGQSPAQLAEKYSATKFDIEHPLAVFQWAYPAYLAEKAKALPGDEGELYDIRNAMQSAANFDSPHNYEFDRLRFLAEMTNSSNLALFPMGERLVKRNPKDYEVRLLWTKCMADPEYLHLPVMKDNIEILIKAFPKDPSKQIQLAYFYGALAQEKKYRDPATLNRAIAAYRKVQSLSQPSDKYYKRADFSIQQMHTMKKWYAEHPDR